jgi:hypothetical protein
MEQKPLEDFFNDDPETAEVAETVEVEDTGPPRDEHGRFAPKETGDTAPEPEAEPMAEVPPTTQGLPPETFKGLKEEREKRQNLERELEALKQQIQAAQQPKEPPAPPPSIWEDEQAYGGHIVSTAVQQANMNAVLNMSEMLNRREKQDFDDMKGKFLQMAELNPALAQQALSDPDPWGKAYQIAKNAATMEELGATDLETLKAKLREELAAELKAQVPAAPAMNLPPSLSTARNVGTRSGPAWTGPKSINELLG